ncbi:hypothetical protein OKW30_006793 [Paraburkholderia sp. Clong3]
MVIQVDDLITFGLQSGPDVQAAQIGDGKLVDALTAESVLHTGPKLLRTLIRPGDPPGYSAQDWDAASIPATGFQFGRGVT